MSCYWLLPRAVLLALLVAALGVAHVQAQCRSVILTAYSVEQYPGRTADGTPTQGNAGAIAAASTDIPLGTLVWVEGHGTVRIADRGYLGSTGWLDILVQTTAEALAIGRQRVQACW